MNLIPTVLAISGMRWLDVVVVAAFFGYVAWMAIRGLKRNTSTEQYFLGGRQFPGWAIALSMVGTSLSSITFLALPAAAFALDYRMIVPNLMLPIVAVIAAIYFVPLYRRVSAVSAFEYLEKRFSPMIRLYAALTFLLMQLVRICTVLYLVALPMAYLTGVPILWVVVLGGLFIAAYTVFGGLEAVVWTDVLQTFILLGGGLLCMGIILFALPGGIMGGLGEVIEIGSADDKFSLGSTSWSFSERTLWTMLILGLVNFASDYVGNQAIVQRYLATRTQREAQRATLLCAAVSVPIWLMFFFLGTCLYVYYTTFPDPAIAAMSADEVVPYFLLNAVPAGLAGLIIAGCIAAAMSTLDSAINAISTVATIDVVQRFVRSDAEDAWLLRQAKCIAAGAGLLMIGGAVTLHYLPRESMANLGFIAGSLFGGCLLAIFLLGFLTRWVDARSLSIALLLVITLNIYLIAQTFGWLPEAWRIGLHEFWFRPGLNLLLVLLTAIVVLIRRPTRRDYPALTVWSTPTSGSA